MVLLALQRLPSRLRAGLLPLLRRVCTVQDLDQHGAQVNRVSCELGEGPGRHASRSSQWYACVAVSMRLHLSLLAELAD